jgi:hypothetical protein
LGQVVSHLLEQTVPAPAREQIVSGICFEPFVGMSWRLLLFFSAISPIRPQGMVFTRIGS